MTRLEGIEISLFFLPLIDFYTNAQPPKSPRILHFRKIQCSVISAGPILASFFSWGQASVRWLALEGTVFMGGVNGFGHLR